MSDKDLENDESLEEQETEDSVDSIESSEEGEDNSAEVTVEGDSESQELNAEDSSEGEAVNDGPVVYDFAHPSHKLNSRLPVLEIINEKTASMLSSALTAQFHQSIRVSFCKPEFLKFEEYVSSLPDSISISQFRADPLQGNALFVIEGDLVFMLVDSFFGGIEQLAESLGERSFTPTEMRIIERVRDKAFSAVTSAWEPVIKLNPTFQTLMSSMELKTPAHPAAVVVCSRFKVEMKSGVREFHIVIPYSALEPIRAQLTTDLKTGNDNNNRWIRDFSEQVLACDVDIEGVFAESQISVRELMSLKVGDFIPLSKVQTVEFSAEGIPLFDATVGISNGMVSASVSHWHERKKSVSKA